MAETEGLIPEYKNPGETEPARFTRRAFLKKAAIAAATPFALSILNACARGEAILGQQTPIIPETSKPTEKPAEISIFQEIKQKIDQSMGTEIEKAQAHEALNQFEKVGQRIDEFKNYEAQRQTQGEVTLLQLIQKKFNRLDDTFPEFKIAGQVFYLKDENDLKKILNQLKEKSPDEILTSISESQKQFFDEGKFAGRRRIAYITPELAQSPTTEFDLSKTTSPLAPKAAEEFRAFLKEIGLEGKIRLKIILADKLSMGNAAGTFGDFQNIPKIEIAPPFEKETLAKELGHLINPEDDSTIFAHLTPKEALDLAISIEEALGDPQWGRRHPEVPKLFSKALITNVIKWLNNQPLSPTEFASAISISAGWLYDDTVSRFEPPPDNYYTPFKTFDSKFNSTFDKELEKRITNYIEMPDYVGDIKDLLDQLAQFSDWDRVFVELLREKAGDFYKTGPVSELSIAHLRRIFFLEAAWKGDPRIAGLIKTLPLEEQTRLLNSFLNQYKGADSEFFSDAVGTTLSGRLNGKELKLEEPNPYKTIAEKTVASLP